MLCKADSMNPLQTPRLLLREWRDSDLPPFAELNADPLVMEHFPSILTREQSDALAEKIQTRMANQGGWGLWALERKDSGEFIGFTGLAHPTFQADVYDSVSPSQSAGFPVYRLTERDIEIGWRIRRSDWGKGYAPEAAAAALAFAFGELRVPLVVSFTAADNRKSIRVMEKI